MFTGILRLSRFVLTKVTKTIMLAIVLCSSFSFTVFAVPVGEDDFRISNMGPDGDANYIAVSPAIAYNATDNEYLVVWHGSTPSLAINEGEIFGKIINADTGAVVVADFRISTMGPDGNAAFNVRLPAVTWNATENEYVVVWEGDDDSGTLVQDELEIFAQGIGSDGSLLLADDLRISDMGPDGDTTFHAFEPAIVWNSQANEYFVAWSGYDALSGTGSIRNNIFSQRLDANITPIGDDQLISDVTSLSDSAINSRAVAIAYNAIDNRYLVAWYSEGFISTSVLKNEIFVQSLSADGGRLLTNDLRISDMGPTDDSSYAALNPAVAWNTSDNEYLVLWTGDDDTAPLVNNEFEVFGQRLDANAVEIGNNDMRLSNMGPDTNTTYVARNPDLAWSSTDNQYFITWHGDDDSGSLAMREFEIYGRRLNADGSFIEANAERLSSMGSDGDPAIDATSSAVAYNAAQNKFLAVWRGDDDTPPLAADGEFEIYGQNFASSATQAAVLRFSATQYRVSESTGSFIVNVERLGDTTNAVTVDFTSNDGSASAPADYTMVSGSLTFNMGESNQSFMVLINADDVSESDESILLSLSSPVAASGTVSLDGLQSNATLTIEDSTVSGAGDAPASGGGGGALNLLSLLLLGLLLSGTWGLRLRTNLQ